MAHAFAVCLGLVAFLSPAQPVRDPQPVLEEDVEVRLLLVDLRVLDARGQPVHGLAAADLRAEIDGKPAEIDALRWVAGAWSEEEVAEAQPGPAAAGAAAGQLVVLFFQRNINPWRMVGLMRMRPEVMQFVEGLAPADRVAVVVHDHRLRLYSDFTTDRAAVLEILDDRIVQAKPPPPLASASFPSLAAHFDSTAAARAATTDEALGVVADALEPLPGTKALVLVGWGLGRMSGGSARMTRDTASSIARLIDARTSIFGLDVTMADWHTLELPFTRAAVATGGFYAKTHVFTNAAMERVARALDGHYEMWLVRPELRGGRHELKVRLRGRTGTVFHKDHVFVSD